MSRALAEHDALSRKVVEAHNGVVVKMTGDGMYAAFGDPVDALNATAALALGLDNLVSENHVALLVRAGLHLGLVERRNDDLFGSAVNRAARIMKAAHGGQILLSQAVFDQAHARLPPSVSLRDLGAVRLREAGWQGGARLSSKRDVPGPPGPGIAHHVRRERDRGARQA